MLRAALTDFFTRRRRSLAYIGTALALAGGISTTAVATTSSAVPQIASAAQHLNVGDAHGLQRPAASAADAAGASARPAGHAGAPLFDATAGAAPGGQATPHIAAAHGPHHRVIRVRLASRQRSHQRTAGQHAARSVHQATARDRAAQHRSAARHPTRHPAIAARHALPYLIYDSVTPSAIPSHHVIATYATGNYAVSPSQLAGRGKVLWIDTNGTDYAASVLDVEPGDATPSGAASWAFHRLSAQPNALARIYTMRSEWPAAQAAIATLPSRMRSHVRWWIADPTGSPHIVPGSDATQWSWGSSYDVTTATPRF